MITTTNNIILTPETLNHVADRYQVSAKDTDFAGYLAAYLRVTDKRIEDNKKGRRYDERG